MLARRTDGYDFGSSVLRCQRQREQAGVKQFTSVRPDQRYHHRSNLKLKDLKKSRLVHRYRAVKRLR
jgi:hypothetical protein